MARKQLAFLFLLVGVALVLRLRGWSGGSHADDSDTIPYQGHSIKLSRSYGSYEDYKDDPNNIDPSQYKLIEQLVTEAPVAPVYPNRNAMDHDLLFNVRFPGYGMEMSHQGSIPQRLDVESIEIPNAGSERYLVFRIHGDEYVLIDDFVAGESDDFQSIREEDGHLSYYSKTSALVVSHAIKGK